MALTNDGKITEATSYYLNQWWLVYWRIYALLSLNKLNPNAKLFIDKKTFKYTTRRNSVGLFKPQFDYIY